MSKLTVGVLFGGRTSEHEVSLMSARSVLAALDRSKYEVIEIGINHQGSWFVGQGAVDHLEQGTLDQLTPVLLIPDPEAAGLYTQQAETGGLKLRLLAKLDVIFPVLHGTFGEDGTLQGMMEMAGIPYVGAGVLGASVGMDKGVFTDVMRSNGIPVLETLVVL